METRCPNPRCDQQFDLQAVEPDKRGHYISECPHCQIKANFRTMAAMKAIEVAHKKRLEAGTTNGGSHWEKDRVPVLSVLVEDVRSLWNVGSIFRTADGSGFEKIYLTGITGTPPRKEIEKVSLGAENTVAWQYEVNPLSTLLELKSKGVQIVGLEVAPDSELLTDDIKEGNLENPLCLVIGNEVSGLSPQVLATCDRVCHLPMRGMKESLNVAVAFGIAAYAISDALLKVGTAEKRPS